MDTLPDLRVTIAESMEALASTTLDYQKMWSMHFGAQTLRWCADYDATPTDDERDELRRLRELADVIDDALSRVNVNGKREHPGGKLSAIRAAFAELVRHV